MRYRKVAGWAGGERRFNMRARRAQRRPILELMMFFDRRHFTLQ
jgi:hypothetical protein